MRKRISAARQAALGDAVRRGIIADEAAQHVNERYEVAAEQAKLTESDDTDPNRTE